MAKTTLEVRMEQFLNSANDLAEELGLNLEDVVLNVSLDTYNRQRQAEKLHERLQDYHGFRASQTECNENDTVEITYSKKNLNITFEF